MIDQAIADLIPVVGVRGACEALDEPQARWYRRHRQSPPPPPPERVRSPQPRALSDIERKELRSVLNSDEHVDEAPATIYAKLLDEGTYLGSISTMYRVLREHDEVRERRRHATHPARVKPELVASRPNQVHSWDITKLLGPVKWTYFYLYVLLDIFSRYVVGWTLAHSEKAEVAKALLADTIEKQGIKKDQLSVHADNGSPMIAKPVAFLLADLGVTRSQPFFTWYNEDHRHSGIGLHTPADVHYGRAEKVRSQRAEVLGAAYAAHPERFVRKVPTPPALPTVVWIDEPKGDDATTQ